MTLSLQQKLSNTLKSNKSTPASKLQQAFPSAETWAQKFKGPTTTPITKVYTGDKMIGIATMHKSNAVPVFSQESAQDIGKMK